MSTDVQEATKEATTTEALPDWAAGYAMDVPCIVEGCDREVMWFGNQHGCRRGHSCDFHIKQFVRTLNEDIAERGYIHCSQCKQKFASVYQFFTAVRA